MSLHRKHIRMADFTSTGDYAADANLDRQLEHIHKLAAKAARIFAEVQAELDNLPGNNPMEQEPNDNTIPEWDHEEENVHLSAINDYATHLELEAICRLHFNAMTRQLAERLKKFARRNGMTATCQPEGWAAACVREHYLGNALVRRDKQQQQQQHQKENNTMSQYIDKAVATPTLVYGTDISELNEPQLIDMIRGLKGKQKALADVGVESKKLTQRKAELDTALAAVVAELDSRE